MKFLTIALFAGLQAASVTGQSSNALIGSIQDITKQSSDLNTLTGNLNIVNVLIQGPRVSTGLQNITATINQILNEQANPPVVFSDSEASDILNVVTTYVQVSQQMLSTIIGKHGLLSLFFLTEPARVSLVGLEASQDALAFSLNDEAPTQSTSLQKQFGSLTITIKAAITAYSSS